MKICWSYSSNITIVEAKILLRQTYCWGQRSKKKATEDFGAPLMFDTSPESMWAQMAAQRLLWQLPPDPPSPIFSTAGAPASSGVTKFFSIFPFAPKPERGDSIQTSFSLLKLSKLSCTRDALMLDSSNALIPKQLLARQHRPDFVQFPERLLEAVTGALQVTVERGGDPATPEMTWAEWLSTVSTVLTSNCCSIF